MNQLIDYFNCASSSWDDKSELNHSKINSLLDLLHIKADDQILDVGCGTGVLIPYLSERVAKGSITGIDFAEKMIDIAKNKFSSFNNIVFKTDDIESWNEKKQYNQIILYSVFPHLKHKVETISKLYHNNLAPGGKLFIVHGRGRAYLNQMHKHKHHSMKDALLIEVSEQANMFEQATLFVSQFYEDDELYYILLEKR